MTFSLRNRHQFKKSISNAPNNLTVPKWDPDYRVQGIMHTGKQGMLVGVLLHCTQSKNSRTMTRYTKGAEKKNLR